MTTLQTSHRRELDPPVALEVWEQRTVPPARRGRKPRKRSWEVAAEAAMDGVRRIANQATAPDEATARHEVTRQLEAAESYLNLPATIRTWWLGSRLQGVWAHIHLARVAMIELMDAAQVDAYSPRVLTLADKYLKVDEPERIAIRGWFDRLDGRRRRDRIGKRDRMALAQALQSAHERMADEYHRLRRFQISIGLGAALILLLVAGLVLLGARQPNMVPLCFPDPDALGAGGTAVCPSGEHEKPAGSDVAVVVLFGLLGAVLTGVRFVVQHTVASSVPMSTTRCFQALFKAAVGTLAAVLGLLFLRAGAVPGFTQIDTQSQILAYAVVFGAAQELITRLIDQRSNTLLAGATATDRDRQPTASSRS
jgi:hypothetical protein